MRAAIAEYHRWGGRNGKHSVLTALGAGKSRVEEPADLACRWPPSCCVHMVEKEGLALPLLIASLIPSWGSSLVTSSKPTYPQRLHLQIPSHCRLRLQHVNLGQQRHAGHSPEHLSGCNAQRSADSSGSAKHVRVRAPGSAGAKPVRG